MVILIQCGDPQPCAIGTYSTNGKKYLGDGACKPCTAGAGSYCLSGSTASGGTPCPTGFYCIGGSNDKQVCPSHSNSASGMSVETDCICNAGSTGPDGSCDECVAGKYKIASGDAACTNCSAGRYSTVVGAVSEWQCQPCTAGAYCTSGSDKMQACGASAGRYCPLGSTASEGTPCPAGFYCTGGSNDKQACGAGKYSAGGASECSQCESGPDGKSCMDSVQKEERSEDIAVSSNSNGNTCGKETAQVIYCMMLYMFYNM